MKPIKTPRVSRQRRGRPYTKSGKSGGAQKRAVLGLVERGGKVRTFHVQNAAKKDVREIIVRAVSRKSELHTDESKIYTELGREFAAHKTVNHRSGEYARGKVHTNTVENVWSVFKRGMKGIYQHCGEAHLHRYIAEFDFRYNRRSKLGISDAELAIDAIKGAEGKRLVYSQTGEA